MRPIPTGGAVLELSCVVLIAESNKVSEAENPTEVHGTGQPDIQEWLAPARSVGIEIFCPFYPLD